MNRRTYLAATGASLASLSGCLGVFSGGGSGAGPTMTDDLPADENPDDGLPPEFSQTVEPASADPSSFATTNVQGTAVPLAPIDVVYNWYVNREARIADARGLPQYQRSHILGAVSSPVGGTRGRTDPVTTWPKDARVVCYCGCPHHLSSMRAAALIESGYSNVFVIDEGFWAWHDRQYPMAGRDLEASPDVVAIRGVTAPAHAGSYAWAVHEASGQMEAAPIDEAGRYRLELHFSGLSESTPIRVRTPEYEFVAPLRELTADVVTGPPGS